MNQSTVTYSDFVYEKGPEWWNARDFHEWLLYHPKLARFNRDVEIIISNQSWTEKWWSWWTEVLYAIDLMEKAHWNDTRKRTGSPYIVHQFEIIKDYLKKTTPRKVNLHKIVVLLLHDVIEDHPEYWKEIYNKFWVRVFRDVLILWTGWIAEKYRGEILNFLNTEFNLGDTQPWDALYDLLQMLSPMDPYEKLQRYAPQYSHSWKPGENYKKIEKAIAYYAIYFFSVDPRKPHKPIYNDEYIALGNYLYMNKDDALLKLEDMLNNMSDMSSMWKEYIEKRQIKAYILMAKLRIFWLNHAVYELYQKFESSWHPMLSESQIEELIQQKAG